MQQHHKLSFTMTAKFLYHLQCLLLLVFVLVLTVTILTGSNLLKRISFVPNFVEFQPVNLNKAAQCYRSPDHSNSINYFVDVLDAKIQPKIGQTIFFHETTCSETGIVHLNAKQACAIESAARLHPNRDIFVLFASPVGVNENAILPQFYKQIQLYGNVHVRNINLWRYSANTPAGEWLKTNELFESSYLFEHMSDIVRAITLYRFGGYHMDLDMIVQRNVDALGENFIGDDWSTVINSAFIHLNNFGIGRRVLDGFFNELITNFNGSVFIANGPQMLTRVCEKICNTEIRTNWTRERCAGLTFHPKETFYPISWSNYTLYFEPNDRDEALKLTKNATLVHVWNDRSKDIWNKIGTNNAYQVLAAKYCPVVYSECEYF